jgi:hypothetical protein
MDRGCLADSTDRAAEATVDMEVNTTARTLSWDNQSIT